ACALPIYAHVRFALRRRYGFPCVFQYLQRLRRNFIVTVERDDEFAARLAHAAIESRFLVLVLLPDVPDRKRALGLPGQHGFMRAVGRAVIDDQPFEVPAGLLP